MTRCTVTTALAVVVLLFAAAAARHERPIDATTAVVASASIKE
jgi:hypothetical protein